MITNTNERVKLPLLRLIFFAASRRNKGIIDRSLVLKGNLTELQKTSRLACLTFIQKSRLSHRCRGQTRASRGSVDRVRYSRVAFPFRTRVCCSAETPGEHRTGPTSKGPEGSELFGFTAALCRCALRRIVWHKSPSRLFSGWLCGGEGSSLYSSQRNQEVLFMHQR